MPPLTPAERVDACFLTNKVQFYRLAERVAGRAAADDVVAAAWRELRERSFDPEDPEAKILQVALLYVRRRAIDMRRADQTHGKHVRRLEEHVDAGLFALGTPNPEDSIAHSQLVSEVKRLFDDASPRSRQMLTLRFLEEISVSEIAAQLNCSRANVSQTIKRNLQEIRAALTEMMPELFQKGERK